MFLCRGPVAWMDIVDRCRQYLPRYACCHHVMLLSSWYLTWTSWNSASQQTPTISLQRFSPANHTKMWWPNDRWMGWEISTSITTSNLKDSLHEVTGLRGCTSLRLHLASILCVEKSVARYPSSLKFKVLTLNAPAKQRKVQESSQRGQWQTS